MPGYNNGIYGITTLLRIYFLKMLLRGVNVVAVDERSYRQQE